MKPLKERFLTFLDISAEIEPGQDTSGWLFALGCPVISKPELRPFLDAIDLYSLVNIFDCRTAGRTSDRDEPAGP